MIICASRRTDIPAFHPRWMMARLREGSCLVRNPIARTSLLRVDLSRRNVDCIVFMTKDPRPMEPYLPEVGRMGHMYVFQVTLTPYGRAIEPGVPFKADISDCCHRISDRIGRDRMVWRYDPVLYGRGMDSAYHARKFEMMCREASSWTDRCVFSFVDMYGRTSRAGDLYRGPTPQEADAFLRTASEVAKDYGMVLSCCCPRIDVSRYGIEQRGCVDAAMMRSLDVPYETQDVPIRDGCRCVRSIDIGEYDTCGHDCAYCYANRSKPEVRRTRLYCDDTELLWGAVMPRDRIEDSRGRGSFRLEDFRIS